MSIEYIPGLAGVPATESAISDIDGDKGILFYRGYPIEQLVKNASFEDTIWLLMQGELPSAAEKAEFIQSIAKNRRIKHRIESIYKQLPVSTHAMQALQLGMLTLASLFEDMGFAQDGVYSREQQDRIGVIALAQVSTLVAMWGHIQRGYNPIEARDDLSYAGNFLYMVTGEEPDALMTEIFDACLILHAEHTINASTFTVMVTSSTLSNPYSALSAGIASLAGPLHGGANRAVLNMIHEIGTPDKAEAYIDKRLKNKEVIWGMGHREYKTKDPRAVILEKMMMRVLGAEGKGSVHMETAKRVEEICEARLGEKGVYPNVDFYSGILYSEMGLPADLFTPIFAISRTSGWLAHCWEQWTNNRIFRPTQIYVGKSPRDYPKAS